MKVFSVIGISSSGKTTTIESIIRQLRQRGYTVASVKDIHFEQFALDTPGSNTDRHRQAGSGLVTARGFYETDVLYQQRLPIEQLLQYYYDYDFVALEGVSDWPCPNIITAHTVGEVEERRNEQTFAVAGRIANELREVEGLPCISALMEAERLTDRVEEYAFAYRPAHCYRVNGKPLPLRVNALLSEVLGELSGAVTLEEEQE